MMVCYRLKNEARSRGAAVRFAAIPATTRVDHIRQNMGAATGRLPDPDLRQRMIRYVEGL